MLVLRVLYVDFVCHWEAFPSTIFENKQKNKQKLLGLKLLLGAIYSRVMNNFWNPTTFYDVAFSSLGGSY